MSMHGTSASSDQVINHLSLEDRLAEIIAQYRQERKLGKVVEYQTYQELKAVVANLNLEAGAEDLEQVWQMVTTYLANSVKTSHPQYFNQLWSGQSDAALIGGIVEVMANTSMYTYEVAPMATLVENQMLGVFKKKFGFESGEAQVTTGGSNSNYLALMLSLHHKFPQVKTSGLHTLPPVAVFVSQESHYSLDKAAVMLGIGTDSLYRIAVDERGAMSVDSLEQAIAQAKEDGRVPLCIVGTAGTTVRGAYDPFESLAEIAKAEEAWFHIDGAWGGGAVFADKEKRYLKGFELADSMAWDAHKMLGVPLMFAMLFVREAGHFDRVCNLGDTSYIFHADTEDRDLGPYSLQCGRRVDSFKCWLEYLYYGEAGFTKRINRFMALAEHAEAIILETPELELQSHRWINNICFRFTHPAISDLEAFNREVRNTLHQSGQSFVNVAYLDGEFTIRLIIANHEMTEENINIFFKEWLTTARTLLPQYL